MAYSYAFLEGAQRELDAILGYLVERSGSTAPASAFLDVLETKLTLVCDNPELYGLSRMPEISELGYRVFFVKRYVVLYFFRDECVFVAHVFHQRQDYARLI